MMAFGLGFRDRQSEKQAWWREYKCREMEGESGKSYRATFLALTSTRSPLFFSLFADLTSTSLLLITNANTGGLTTPYNASSYCRNRHI